MSESIALLNTSILTNFGTFLYREASLKEVLSVLFYAPYVESFIGHQSTADLLAQALGRDVPIRRTPYSQQVGEVAVVFKLNGRAPEGTILSREEIEAIGYTLGFLCREA